MEKISGNTRQVWFKDQLIRRLEDYVILRGFRVSMAHNTYDPDGATHDDKDIMGVYIPPPEVVFGIENMETIERFMDEKLSQKRTVTWDIVYYSLPKYLRLILKQNPNVIMLLWLSEKHYLKRTSLGQRLIDNRDRLLSKQCYDSFCGYAHGQLHRMTHHAPTGKMGAKRKELVQKFGYDTKNASHLIRLLKMGLETLTTGEMQVERPDNNMLLAIKRGEWELQKVLDYSDKLFQLLDEALVRSELPNKVDREFVNQLCEDITRGYYYVGGLQTMRTCE
jgi:predicted nucleotidyltransferase